MRAQLFVACLVASILVNAAIIDSASLGNGSVRRPPTNFALLGAGDLVRWHPHGASSLEAPRTGLARGSVALESSGCALIADAEGRCVPREALRSRHAVREEVRTILVAAAAIAVGTLF